MAEFSILKRDNRPARSAAGGAVASPILAFNQPSSTSTAPELRRGEPIDLEVVLTLPDLTNVLSESTAQPWFARIPVFWIAITLGALLAFALIWTGRKPTPRAVDEAPAWSHSAAESAPQAATITIEQSPSSGGAPAWSPSTQASAAPVAPSAGQQPSTNYPTNDAPAGVRTARGDNPQWDGTTDRVPPGEAAPLGISTTVPQ